MKKTLLLLLSSLTLVGCSKPSGVKCKTIKLTEGGSTVFSDSYHYTAQSVFRYKGVNNNGYIYTNVEMTYSTFDEYGNPTVEHSTIKVFNDKTASSYREFTFDAQLGYVKYSHNVYLDIGKKKIELVDGYEKMNDYDYNMTPEEKSNNADAYSGVKSEYYFIDLTYGYHFGEEFKIYKDSYKNNTEKHTYINYGDSASVTYTLLED